MRNRNRRRRAERSAFAVVEAAEELFVCARLGDVERDAEVVLDAAEDVLDPLCGGAYADEDAHARAQFFFYFIKFQNKVFHCI